jgi:hypothetical protein
MAGCLSACNIPVFRYALENWIPASYLVLIVHRGGLSTEDLALTERLSQVSSDPAHPVNVSVYVVDLDREDPLETDRQDLPGEFLRSVSQRMQAGSPAEPTILVYPPGQLDPESAAWSGPLTSENVSALVDSPARQEIAQRLLDGQSAVWVLIESGDSDQDRKAAELLTRELDRMKSVVELPDRALIEAEDEFRPENPIELRVEFSLIRLSREDSKEKAFIAMLLSSEPDLRDFEEPMALPIFGRGRTHFALIGNGITPANIEESCRFLCGACSCQIKQQNPGIDLLMAVNWDKQIVGSAMRDPELPELTGIGFLDVGANAPGSEPVEVSPDSSPVESASSVPDQDTTEIAAARQSPPSAEESSTSFERSLIVRFASLVALSAVVIAVISLLILRR